MVRIDNGLLGLEHLLPRLAEPPKPLHVHRRWLVPLRGGRHTHGWAKRPAGPPAVAVQQWQ
jgi:hypothetical protein